MPGTDAIKPSHKAIQRYYEALQSYGTLDVEHETALRSAFQNLLADSAKSQGWTLVPEQRTKSGGKVVIPDGTLRDSYNLHRGFWEAKDGKDDLNVEIQRKIAKGYPLTNIIFEDTRRAVLFQNGQERLRADLADREQLARLLNQYFGFTLPDFERFDQAVDEFKERVPDLAQGLVEKIQAAHKSNSKFQTAFDHFFSLCQTALNPNISRAAVDEMLVQHLLTERLIRKIFDNPEFMQRNVIALEVEKVIAALVSKSFNRDDFLKSLDLFYRAIEDAARGLEDFTEKQHFLNTVYERFFQGYSVKVADTHGIVYTPQEIVDFMCARVGEVLDTEFGKSLGDKDVHILDPCMGTGNFIVNLLRRIPKKDLPRMYRQQLFANEIMLLPYYIAALNNEHAHYEITGSYEPFEGLCFVDTLDLAEARQGGFSFITESNTARVERQKKTLITVIIGNPPYSMGQKNENENNKNRRYKVVDERIRDTYAKESTATLKNKLYDPYVRFFRWSVDRLGSRPGIVCFVSNNSFVDQKAFDGMQRVYLTPSIFPSAESEKENAVICRTIHRQMPFISLVRDCLPNEAVGGRNGQCFPFYTYEDGSHRRENITDGALEQFRVHYQDKKINKWDIFYYVYGMLEHSGYREKFADNLKRELPRLPFAKDFRGFSAAGKELARLHLDYEQMEPFRLKWIESKDVPLSYRVEDKIRVSKDKKSLTVNSSLTLSGIPSEVFEYRLGSRSALEWVIDQYQVTEDNRTGIRSDPNRADDEEYIVRLVGQVIQVSLETVRIVSALPKDYSG